MLQAILIEINNFSPILYRPFDIQWIFYHALSGVEDVKRVMRHMIKDNLGLNLSQASIEFLT